MQTLPIFGTDNGGKSRKAVVAVFLALTIFCAMTVSATQVRAQEAAVKTEATQAPNAYRPLYDFTGDNKTDFANVVADTVGSPIGWRILRNPAPAGPGEAFIRYFDYGIVGDSLAANNYIGDAKTDVAVWRSGVFYIQPFPESGAPFGAGSYTYWGNPTGENLGRDGDYDGDGTDDETTVRLAGNLLTWYMNLSSGGTRQVQFGQAVAGRSTLAFQGADFTGDGRDELVFCTASTAGVGVNTWWIGDAVTGAIVLAGTWGNFVTDYFVNPDDYTGDGKADLVTFRAGGSGADAGGWFIRDTSTGALVPPVIFGISDPAFLNNDAPIRGNFDGDARADIGVWRPSTATYYWIRSSDGLIGGQQWGTPALTADFTEFPLPTLFCF